MEFSKMRRGRQELPREEAEALLARGAYGVLSTCGENGYPYGIPVNYVFADGRICFHCAAEGAKLRNLAYCDKVCFTVVDRYHAVPEAFSAAYASVVAFGSARLLSGAEKRAALNALIEKYAPHYREAGERYIDAQIERTRVAEIRVEALTGKTGAIDLEKSNR